MEITNCNYCDCPAKVSGKRRGGYERIGTIYYVMCNKCKMRGPQFNGADGELEGNAYVGGDDPARALAIKGWNDLQDNIALGKIQMNLLRILIERP